MCTVKVISHDNLKKNILISMIIKIRISLVFALLFLLTHIYVSSANAETSPTTRLSGEDETLSITGCFIQSSIKLDGLLTEPCWQIAVPATNFKQREPIEGAPATEKTEVKILYDDMNLYIGIICFDKEPEKIVHNELRIDGNLKDDDNFAMIIDTFNDKREGFYFATNPNGARKDGKIDGNSLLRSRFRSSSRRSSGGINDDWNGIWDVSAKITDYGWSAEIVIPFKTLRFPKGEIQNWGINFKRDIIRKNEEVLWSSWSRNDGLMQISKTGILCDLKNIQRGKKIEFKPFTLGGMQNEEGEPGRTFKYGLDVKYPLASDLTLDLTTFTDFAQIEADQEKINLTRFDLIYPEKRDFFIEGAEIFQFGSRYSNPFYSRRIGITEDEDENRYQVPILAGAKVTGKVGKYRIGLINMQTDEKSGQLSTNYSVVRVKREIFEKSFIGIIATNLHSNDKKNKVYGADFSYRTDKFLKNKNLAIESSYIDTQTPGINHGTSHKRLQIIYPNELLDIFLYYKVDDKNFNPEMGFAMRPDAKTTMAIISYNPRPGISAIRKLRFAPINMEYITDMNNRLLTRKMEFSPFGFDTNSGEEFNFTITNLYENLEEDFELLEDVNIPVGIYTWLNYETTFRSNSSRFVSVQLKSEWGDFFNGTRTEFDTELKFKVNKYFSFSNTIIYNNFHLNSNNFETKEYGMRLNANYSTRLTSKTFIQWNNETKEFNLNFRIHFIPKIGSDIYFVYNHLLDGYNDYRTSYNTAITKIAYLIIF